MGVLAEDPHATQLHGALVDALDQTDLWQEVEFLKYVRYVLPLDGFVFWIAQLPIRVRGFLHHDLSVQQSEDETAGVARVVFSTAQRIDQFDAAPTDTIYVARYGGFRYAFSSYSGRDWQANLWHYSGSSILPSLASQLIDSDAALAQLNESEAVVSNSLPLWLALNSYSSPFSDNFQGIGITLYPADLVPTNLVPPYGVVNIESTETPHAVPYIDTERNYWQLAQDHVKLTLYGLQNNAALDFIGCVNQYSAQGIGVADSSGIVRRQSTFGLCGKSGRWLPNDTKKPQTELQAIAMQKTYELDVSYYQHRAQQIAQQLITSAKATYFINPYPS